MFGPMTRQEILQREVEKVVGEVLTNRGLGISDSASISGGMPQLDQDFYFDEENKSQSYLRCGDSLDSSGLAP